MPDEKNGIQKSELQSGQGEGVRPWEIDLSGVPYHPLPPSPNAWVRKDPEPPSAKTDLFELDLVSGLGHGEIKKLDMEERPDPAFKVYSPMKNGCLFIDKYGNASSAPQTKAIILFRSYSGSIQNQAELSHDIYRIGTTPAGTSSLFLSSDCILHGYDGQLAQFLDKDLKQDARIQMMDSRDLFAQGEPIRRRIRTLAISPKDQRILVTAVDTAFCMDKNGKNLWAVSLPLGDGWEREISRSKEYGDRVEIESALKLMKLKLPVTQSEIKKMYRTLSKEWHPDLNPKDPSSTKKMQELNQAFEILTGVDAGSLKISEHPVVHYRRKKPDIEIETGGITFSLSFGGPSLDWIYASSFAFDNEHVYLGSYAGKIVRLTSEGDPTLVLDVGNVPREIVDTGDYLFIRTDARLYILNTVFSLVEIIDIYRKSEFIVTPQGFGMLAKKNLKWFSSHGSLLGEVRSKHPLRAVYIYGDELVVETRQHSINIEL